MIYQPAEDSYLLSKAIEEYLKKIKDKKISILDIGSGSGIQAQTCKESGFTNLLVTDVNPKVVKHLRKKGFKSIKSDLFSNIGKNKKFDLIIFNPPYLPLDKREPKDSQINTVAGKQGYEIIIKFLKQAVNYLSEKGSILLLFSSFSKPEFIKKTAQKIGYNLEKLATKKLFFEEIFVYKLTLSNP